MNTNPIRVRRWAIDWQGLGLPGRPSQLPHPSEFYGSDEGCARIAEHYEGKRPLDQLEEEERRFLREHITAEQQRIIDDARARFLQAVPRRYANVQPDERTADWVQRVTANHEETPSLLIVGPTGTGKTHLAWATLRAVVETGASISTRWKALTAVDMYASLRPGGSDDPEAALRTYSGTQLLFIDDLAAAKATEWTEEITYRIVNHRYEQCLPTIITSNVPPNGMREILGERVASRLTEMCERVVLKGDDLRKRRTA